MTFSAYSFVRFFVYAFVVVALYSVILGAPARYPSGEIVVIPPGATITEAGETLKEKGAIQWPVLFSLLVRASGNAVIAGPYFLPAKESVITLASRLSHGKTGLTPAKVTVPEGTSVRQAADILKKTLGSFDKEKFTTLAKPDEGYLFPDTYFFLPGASPESVIAQMKNTFDTKTAPLQKDIAAFGRPESDIVTMASILEKEGRQPETRRIIAGILWKRLQLGMPLQVDAAFGYIFDTDTYSPSGSDLDVDSPYNTYKYRGLPPGPIGNPGIEAIEDAMTPIKTSYLYYVTDKEGNIYYAKTFEEHLRNKIKAGS